MHEERDQTFHPELPAKEEKESSPSRSKPSTLTSSFHSAHSRKPQRYRSRSSPSSTERTRRSVPIQTSNGRFQTVRKEDASGEDSRARGKNSNPTNHLIHSRTKSSGDRSSSFRGRDRDCLVEVESQDCLCEKGKKKVSIEKSDATGRT